MATDVPSAHVLKTWEEAFQHPIPTVRRIEQELRRDIVSNREKLRSLVGVRYRDLLETAQTIMEMDEKMKRVEINLSGIGRNCNPGVIFRKVNGLHQLQEDNSGKVSTDRTYAAQLTLLSNCASAVSKYLRRRESTIIVARLLVISRLLLNSLSQSSQAKDYIERLRNRLIRLRRTFLARIDTRLMSLTSSAQDVDESLSAYCLATSSSAEDAIRYFHEVRIRAISRQVQHVGALRQNLLNALNLYIHTLRQTADVLSGRLFNSLKKLTMQPVLADPTIRQIGELGIDVYQAWISKEIIFFTPWIKHGQTSKSSADKIITSWSKLAFESLVTEATTALLGCEEFQDALAIRQGLLEAWLPVLNSVPCFSSIDVLEGIRNLMNDRLISILQRQTEKLTHVGVELSSIVTSWSKLSFKTSLSLWDPELVFLDPSDGAVTFKRQLTRRALGQEDHVLQFLNIYENWLTDTMNHFALIRELQNVRWEDILEDDVDEELLESVTGLLKDDDFQLLHISLKKCLRSEYQSLQLKLNEIVEEMDGQHQGLQAAFLLRIIRAIRGSMPDQVVREGYVFAEDIASTMHGILGDEIVRQISLSTLTKSLRRRRQRCAGRTLWEGDPQLPVQPSQAAFKLLQRVTLLMDQQGPDLWNSAAVNDLKSRLISQILSTTKKCLDKGPMKATPVEKSSTNGDIGGEEAGAAQKESEFEIARDHRFQLLFDILFLGFALGQDEAVSDEPLKSFTDAVKEGSELNDDSIEVVKIRSQEYWKRTKLLFGLLS